MRLAVQIKLWLLTALMAVCFQPLMGQSAPDTALVDRVSAAADSALLDMAAAGDEMTDTVATPMPHHLWDAEMPVATDTSSDWWLENRPMVRAVDTAKIKEIRSNKAFLYEDKNPKETRNWALEILSGILQYLISVSDLIIILVVIGLLAMLFYFMRQQGLFRRKGLRVTDEAPDRPDEEVIGVAAYESKIQAAVGAGQFRLAVRLLYLQALCMMESKQLIAITKDKTNADYLRSLHKTPWYASFAGITLDYEYIWYGEMALSEMQFQQVYGQFRAFKNELGYTA